MPNFARLRVGSRMAMSDVVDRMAAMPSDLSDFGRLGHCMIIHILAYAPKSRFQSYFLENLYSVTCRNSSPGRNMQSGKSGWFGASGQFCVSMQKPAWAQ